MIKKSRRGVEFHFATIFAVIAGAVIIFLAVFATVKLIGFEKKFSDTESAFALSNLMNPITNGITSAYANAISFKKETRVYVNCSAWSSKSDFGKETIAFSEESGFIRKWGEPGEEISRYNKYIFSKKINQGKKLYIFSKPFYLGFRVDDLIMITMEDYCFIKTPSFIEEELLRLGIENINFSEKIDLCKKNSVVVCFGDYFSAGVSGCDIAIAGDCSDGSSYCKTEYDTGTISIGKKTMPYVGNLLYAGIFSSPEIYECNVKRLGIKIKELGKVYKEKIEILKTNGCSTVIEPYLDQIILLAENLTSGKLVNLNYQAEIMDEQNCNNQFCRIYNPEDC